MLKDYGKQSCNNGNGIINTPALHLYKTISFNALKIGSLNITAGNDIISTCQVHVGTYKLTQSQYFDSKYMICDYCLSKNQHEIPFTAPC